MWCTYLQDSVGLRYRLLSFDCATHTILPQGSLWRFLQGLCRSLRRHISPSLSPFWHCLVGSKTSSPMQFVKAVMLDNLFSLHSVDFSSKDGILGCQPLKPLPDDSNKVVGHILRCSGHLNHNYNLVVLTVHACANCWPKIIRWTSELVWHRCLELSSWANDSRGFEVGGGAEIN